LILSLVFFDQKTVWMLLLLVIVFTVKLWEKFCTNKQKA